MATVPMKQPKKSRWITPDSKVYGANMGSIWGRRDPGGPHVGPMNLAIWDVIQHYSSYNHNGNKNNIKTIFIAYTTYYMQ